MPLETFMIIEQLAQIINQLTQVFHNVGYFVYADLNFSMNAAITIRVLRIPHFEYVIN